MKKSLKDASLASLGLVNLYDGPSSTIVAYLNLFLGQMPIFSCLTPTFFSLDQFFIGFPISLIKSMNVVCEKTCFLESIAHFFMTCISLTQFGPFCTNHNHFETVFYLFGIFSDVISNHCGVYLINSQHICD